MKKIEKLILPHSNLSLPYTKLMIPDLVLFHDLVLLQDLVLFQVFQGWTISSSLSQDSTETKNMIPMEKKTQKLKTTKKLVFFHGVLMFNGLTFLSSIQDCGHLANRVRIRLQEFMVQCHGGTKNIIEFYPIACLLKIHWSRDPSPDLLKELKVEMGKIFDWCDESFEIPTSTRRSRYVENF